MVYLFLSELALEFVVAGVSSIFFELSTVLDGQQSVDDSMVIVLNLMHFKGRDGSVVGMVEGVGEGEGAGGGGGEASVDGGGDAGEVGVVGEVVEG